MLATSTDARATAMNGVARRTWAALGTTCTVLVTRPDRLAPACAAVEAELDLVDATYSRFRADSESTRLNGSAGRPTVVSPLLGEAISAALQAARVTDGAVDPTVGRAMRAIGYDTDFADLSGRDVPLVLRLEAVPGWRAVGFDATRRLLTLPQGVELDLGSVGKALAADRSAAAAHRAMGAGGVLVGLGGDIAIAGPTPRSGWPVLVAEDSHAPSDGPGEVLRLTGGAIATSSTTVRRWAQSGLARHHLVDPATGAPVVTPWRSATVLAGSCVDANTAATAAIVKADRAVEWLARIGLSARLIANDGRVLRLNGWPSGEAVAA
ncbi:MAG: FAD:protein FMN transferase [Candidatus Limnocylindrales bacterium]